MGQNGKRHSNEKTNEGTNSAVRPDEPNNTASESVSPTDEEEEMSELKSENSPFEKHLLIKNLLPDLEYSYFEAYDENIYLGTKSGDLLHYFEIERHNYMLVSRTKFDDESSNPISKIILLPEIERALVLCGGIMVVFLLPEFAPAPNTTKFKGVFDIALRNYSSQFNSYKFYTIKEDSIQMLKISSQSIHTIQNFDFKLINNASAIDYILMTSKLNSYEIINLKDSTAIPLFPVSETNAPLNPIITKFSDNEFLVTTGGGSRDDNSIAFIINSTGEISHGTIIFDKYPENVIIEYPYVLANLSSNQIVVFKLSQNEEPQLVQKMLFKDSDLQICKTSRIFNNFEPTQTKDKIKDKLRLVPLDGKNHQFRTDGENTYIDEIFEEKTSLIAYGKFGVELLIRRSPVLDFIQHGEPEIDNLENYLKRIKNTKSSRLEQVERNYLMTMMLLLITLHCKVINEEVIEKWCSKADRIDLKLVFYLLDLTVYGELWVFHGLTKLIDQLKSLNLINKCSDLINLLRSMKSRIKNLKFKKSIEDYNNVIKMTDINILRRQLKIGDNNIEVDSFEESSLDEITSIVEENSEDHLEVLLSIYRKRRMFKELISILKRKKYIEKILQFLKEYAGELPFNYKLENLTDDLIFVIKETPQLNKNIIKDSLIILSIAQLNPSELLKRAGNDTKMKVFILEEIGPRSSDDKEFLVNFYMAKLQETLQDGDIWDLFASFAAEYTQNMTYTKCGIAEFLLIKLRHKGDCKSFTECYQSIKDLCKQDDGERLLRLVIAQIKAFDVNYMLTLLFIPQHETKEEFLTRHEMFHTFLSFNDFMAIEKFINEDTILEVFRHYNSLPRGSDSLKLTVLFLKRNFNCVHSDTILIALLKEIPREYSFEALVEVIHTVLKRIEDSKKELELQKALLKNENTINSKILANISK